MPGFQKEKSAYFTSQTSLSLRYGNPPDIPQGDVPSVHTRNYLRIILIINESLKPRQLVPARILFAARFDNDEIFICL